MKKSQQKFLVATFVATVVSTMLTFISVQASPVGSTIITNRISGNDRYTTANEVSKKFTAADTVIIASGEKFPDALCAAPLSKQYNSPILLSSSTSLTKGTLAEIARLKATKAIIIGGTGVISLEVEKQLTSAGVTSTRIGAKDRYETSLLVAQQLNAPTDVVIASGENFPDALSISGIAAQLNMPVILIGKNGLSTDTQTYINGIRATNTYIVGGTDVVSKNIETQVANPIRLAGADRYETNIKVLDQFKAVLNLDTVFLATGKDFADALSGSSLASKSASPVILTGNNLTPQKNFFNKNSTAINNITVLGGDDVVTNATVASLIYSSTIVIFQDKNLEGVVRKAILKPTGAILKSEVNKITQLAGYGMSISNLSGLENFTNLTYLVLNPSKGDLTPITVLNISALKGLTKLSHLTLPLYKIDDLDAIRDLTNLSVLSLYDSVDSNIDALKGLNNLITLSLDSQTKNIDALKGLTNLSRLTLSGTQVNNLDALKGLTNLTYLGLYNTQVNNIDGLKGLTNLTDLSLSHSQVSNIEALKELTNLTYLGLYGNKITNIDALKGLTNLSMLGLQSNQITNIDSLKGLTKLTLLLLKDNPITDYTPVSSYYNNLSNPDFKLQ